MATTLKLRMTRAMGRTGLTLKQHGPEILLFAGIIGGITAAVLASRVTEEARRKKSEMVKQAETMLTTPDETKTEQERNQELGMVYIRGSFEIAKLYAPAIGVGALSIAALLTSHGIMTRRQASVVAAYNLVSEAFIAYRKRVIEELGTEKDEMFRYGVKEATVTDSEYNDADGETQFSRSILVDAGRPGSPYAVLFDETSREWRNDPQSNRYFLKSQQNAMNDKLHYQGHLFLNEVLDALGLPRTSAGAVVGWIAPDQNPDIQDAERYTSDGFVDFNIENVTNGPARDFTDGWSTRIWLDFNVDGVIFDKIQRR